MENIRIGSKVHVVSVADQGEGAPVLGPAKYKEKLSSKKGSNGKITPSPFSESWICGVNVADNLKVGISKQKKCI